MVIPNPPPFSLPLYPLPVSTPSTQAIIQKRRIGFHDNENLITHFRRQNLTGGITPNYLQPSYITHLDIHLKHTWKLANWLF